MSSTDLDLDHNKLIIITSNASPEIQADDNCQTPTKDANKIPIMLAPPPAPRKPAIKRKLFSCKRKLLFGQILVKGEEIDTFFKSSFEELANGNSAIIVKRCKCT